MGYLSYHFPQTVFYLPLAHKYRNESPGSHEDDSK